MNKKYCCPVKNNREGYPKIGYSSSIFSKNYTLPSQH